MRFIWSLAFQDICSEIFSSLRCTVLLSGNVENIEKHNSSKKSLWMINLHAKNVQLDIYGNS